MSENQILIETKIAKFADEVQQQFNQMGENARNTILSGASPHVATRLNKSFGQELGDSVLTSVLNHLILPVLTNVMAGEKIDVSSQKFRQAAGHTLIDIGNSISKSAQRDS